MKIAVGLSGGVDSAVAALLLKEQGHELIGVTMTLGRAGEEKSVAEAQAVADRIGIPLRIFDFAEAWRANVLDYIRDTYLAGRTPNPCVRCNETVKFGLLPCAAFDLGCDRFATGHYARTGNRERGMGNRLLRAVDRGKDQSYFLYRVKPEILSRTVFPLGEMTKDAVRTKARAFGFEAADRTDSQDFCGGDPRTVVGEEDREGEVVTVGGKLVGRHRGYWNYTVGMRKGLGIGGGTPYYVVALDAEQNRVTVGYRADAVRREFEIGAAVSTDGRGLLSSATGDPPLYVKVRSAGEPRGPVEICGTVVRCPDGLVGVAPGQSAVFYRDDEVIGGGIIV